MKKENNYEEAIRELLKDDNDTKATKEDIEKLNEWLVSGKEDFYNWLLKI